MNKIESFIKWAESRNCKIIKNIEKQDIELPDYIKIRYLNIPVEFLEFIKTINSCICDDEKTWFICLKEYNKTSDFAFSWDEIEQMSFIEGEEEFNDDIRKFWDNYLPIVLSVKNGYTYYAIDTRKNIGTIISGNDPEFEEYELIAQSFFEFLDMIMENKILL
jgi:hypothetical protein